MFKSIFLALCLLPFALSLHGQNWAKLKKQGEQYAAEGFYMEAGDAFYKAWKEKPDKLELAWKSGLYYSIVKDYARAAESLRQVAHWNEPDKMAGLKYGRALKQSAQHREAIAAFEIMKASYEGADKNQIHALLDQEIQGSQKALADAGQDPDYQLVHAGKMVNSPATDFAPALFGEDVLYFSSTRSGMSKLYRSLYKNDRWGKPDTPPTLPSDPERHVANGSFSADGQRFYYTVCSMTGKGEDMRARCDIYTMYRQGDSWSRPRKLPEYINQKESTQTHPATAVIDGMEYVFFASDREGGQGGLDIWYVTRELASRSMDYSLPQNAGTAINTAGDDQTPFYDEKKSVLYFASNGHVGYGGLDIYAIDGKPGQWRQGTHLGRPINSEADDFYFYLNTEGTAGFLASNRTVPGHREDTRDEDLFYFTTREIDPIVSGQVLDLATNEPLTGVRIYAYHQRLGEKTVFQSLYAEDGIYEITIPRGLEAWVVAEKPEYEPGTYKVRHEQVMDHRLLHDFRLKAEIMPDEPVLAADTPPIKKMAEPEWDEAPVVKTPPATRKKETAKKDEKAIADTAPAPKPTAPPVTPAPAPAKPEAADIARAPIGGEKKFAHLTPHQNEVRLPENPEEEYARLGTVRHHKPEPGWTPPPTEAIATAPATSKPTATRPARPVGGVGVSVARQVEETADESLFRGSGLEMRYNGKRVDKVKFESETAAYPGIYYRVQLEATTRPDPQADKYSRFEGQGVIETESLPGKSIYRVLVGVYENLEDTKRIQQLATGAGFDRAFIVRYEDGVRLRRWR